MKMSYDEINDDYDRYSPLQINETDFSDARVILSWCATGQSFLLSVHGV